MKNRTLEKREDELLDTILLLEKMGMTEVIDNLLRAKQSNCPQSKPTTARNTLKHPGLYHHSSTPSKYEGVEPGS